MDDCPRCKIDHPKDEHIGTHRYNYELMRFERREAAGWVSLVNPIIEAQALRAECEVLLTINNDRQIRELEYQRIIRDLREQMWLPMSPADFDYHGPAGKDPETGRRVAVHDVFHERFHAAIADVKAGKINREARRQMQEALKNAPRDPVLLNLDTDDDPRRIGSMVGSKFCL